MYVRASPSLVGACVGFFASHPTSRGPVLVLVLVCVCVYVRLCLLDPSSTRALPEWPVCVCPHTWPGASFWGDPSLDLEFESVSICLFVCAFCCVCVCLKVEV